LPSAIHRLLFALALVALTPASALAEWRRAESRNFVVYSDGSERTLREYTAKLERFDALLRSRFGGGQVEDIRKLPVYLVDDDRALRIARPSLPEGIAGYYSSSEDDIFAILVRGQSDNILLHEYGHHFTAQNGAAQYPGWLSEGFAEYFATATVSERGRATFGLPDAGRQYALQQNRWLPMDQLLRAKGSFDIQDRTGLSMYYAQSWVLTHWLLADQTRAQGLARYLPAINGGQDPVEAWQAIFGLTPEQLTTQLRAYSRGRLYYSQMDLPALAPEITVTVLSPAADAVVLPMINARSPNPAEIDGPALLETLRAAAARFPDDPLALVALGRAEQNWGDEAAAEAALTRALERQGDHVEGLLLMADLAAGRGEVAADDVEGARQFRLANGFLRRAMEADPTDYRVYAALARIRRNAPDYPTQNDLLTWVQAVNYAPQVMSIRGDAAIAMMEGRQYDVAIALLTPIVDDPHGGPGAQRARQMLGQIEERRGAGSD
jgi:tetratricopeptide (TPR) repeat protein